MTEQIGQKVSLVILPVDAFAQRAIICPEFEISVDGAQRSIRKPEGFWIFTDHFPECVTVTLRGRCYREMRIDVRITPLKAKNVVQKVYVLPDRDYPFPADTAYMEGTMPEHSVLTVAGRYGMGIRKLEKDCESGQDVLAVYQGAQADLTDTVYLMTDVRENLSEWVELGRQEDIAGSSYRLRTPTIHSYRRTGTDLMPAVRHVTGWMGTSYFIAVPPDAQSGTVPVRCRVTQESGEQNFDILLEKGKILRRDFF